MFSKIFLCIVLGNMLITCPVTLASVNANQISNTDHISNQSYQWGFKKNNDHTPPLVGNHYDNILDTYDAFYLGDTTKKHVYITFDNGYEHGHTSKILDILKQKNVPATFFVTGHYLQSQPDLIMRMVNENHIVGNHSWYHPDLTTKSKEQINEELKKVEDEFERLTGEKGMSYLRPPQGTFSERTLAICNELGYRHVFWSLAFIDWRIDQQKGWEYAHSQIMKNIHPGAIILLHAVSSDNADALEKVIDDLRSKGYEFKSLDNLTMQKIIP